MTPQEYGMLVTNIYNLIVKEVDGALAANDKAVLYPKIITMYEFLRLLRGEAFIDNRPATPGEQEKFYKMEDGIAKKIAELKKKINFDDEKVKYYIAEAQKNYQK